MRLAEELDTTWQIHLSETEEERQNAIKEFGCSPVEYLAKLGCLNERTIAVHCVALSDRDIGLLAESGASVVGGCCGTTPAFIKALHDNIR